MSKLEERLALLEHRVALLESSKAKVPESSTSIKPLGALGVAFLLDHLSDRIISHPHFEGYDKYLESIFKCKITKENRVEYAHKARDLGLSIIDDVIKEHEASKLVK